MGIDAALGATAFEGRCVGRSSRWKLADGIVFKTCSAEDLVVAKTYAGRAQDWVDLNGVLVRRHRALDWNLVYAEPEELATMVDRPGAIERLRAMLAETGRRR
jgi:hypothetical protein